MESALKGVVAEAKKNLGLKSGINMGKLFLHVKQVISNVNTIEMMNTTALKAIDDLKVEEATGFFEKCGSMIDEKVNEASSWINYYFGNEESCLQECVDLCKSNKVEEAKKRMKDMISKKTSKIASSNVQRTAIVGTVISLFEITLCVRSFLALKSIKNDLIPEISKELEKYEEEHFKPLMQMLKEFCHDRIFIKALALVSECKSNRLVLESILGKIENIEKEATSQRTNALVGIVSSAVRFGASLYELYSQWNIVDITSKILGGVGATAEATSCVLHSVNFSNAQEAINQSRELLKRGKDYYKVVQQTQTAMQRIMSSDLFKNTISQHIQTSSPTMLITYKE